MPALNKLYREYRDRAAFYVVYIQEAHPIDAWQVADNLKDDVLVASTMTSGRTDERRRGVRAGTSESNCRRSWTSPTTASSALTPRGRIAFTLSIARAESLIRAPPVLSASSPRQCRRRSNGSSRLNDAPLRRRRLPDRSCRIRSIAGRCARIPTACCR